jgi:1-acyl-sn-glycerol-3-phosphate acyltransferase
MIRLSILSAWSWAVLVIIIIVWTPLVFLVWLVTAPFDKGRYAAGYLFRKLTVVHQRLTPMWKFRTSGELPTDKRRPYVVVANHESFVDMLLISHLPIEMKWLSKETFFKIPLVGWMMRMAGDVKVVRGDRTSGAAALRACHDRLQKKVSVMIFPEGTRTADGSLGPFKDGAFRLAIESGAPILPLVVHGTRSALRKHDWRFGDTEAEVRVLQPIPTEDLTEADIPELRERVRDMIAGEIEEMNRAA